MLKQSLYNNLHRHHHHHHHHQQQQQKLQLFTKSIMIN